MANEGQLILEMLAPLGEGHYNEVDVTWQVADVCRPLLSVSKICDSGASVTFSNSEAVVKGKNGAVLAKFHREGGLYVTDLEFTDEGGSTRPDFTGQGAEE